MDRRRGFLWDGERWVATPHQRRRTVLLVLVILGAVLGAVLVLILVVLWPALVGMYDVFT